MPLAIQYFNGTDYTQFGLDVADYTIKDSGTGDLTANQFYTVKDSQNNCYIYCGHTGSYYKPKIIKISNTGVKTISQCSINMYVQSEPIQMTLSRDEQTIFFESKVGSPSRNIYSLPVSDLASASFTPTLILTVNADGCMFAIYQDRYIWVASGTTVKIYNYVSKAELATNTVVNHPYLAICCDGNNMFYGVTAWALFTLSFTENPPTLTRSEYTLTNNGSRKQLLIDKYGDLILLTNSGTASTLLKYTTAGVQVGATLSLGGAFYNLNTDKDGNYYYSNALGTYKITANTAQGEAFTGVGTKIRGSGMTTYGSNITGYAPAVFGTQE